MDLMDPAVTAEPRGDRAIRWLGSITWLLVAISLYLIFFVAREANSDMGGQLQRIFYFHVPSAWVAYLAFGIAFISSIAYLRTNARRWDMLAHASVEIGVVFCALVLITGPIWARPVWGTWWQWDARLTSILLLELTYIAYLFLRNLATDKQRVGRLAAVVAIVGFLDVPIVHFSVYWWRTLHPQGPAVAPGVHSGLGGPELITFFTSFAAFTVMFAYLLAIRMRLARVEDRIDELQIESAAAEIDNEIYDIDEFELEGIR